MKHDILTLAYTMQAEHGWRWGQSVWNAAERVMPKRVDHVRATSINCFYHDDRVDAFLDEVVPDNIILKFNSGMGAILCPNCSVIIKTFSTFTEDEMLFAEGKLDNCPAYLCDKCKNI